MRLTYAAPVFALTLAGSIIASSPVSAQSETCTSAPQWQTGNNSDEDDQYIGDPQNGLTLLEFTGPASDEGHPVGYTTFAAPVEGLVTGARYRLDLVFQRESNGSDREVSLSVAGLRPQSRVVFRHAGRQTFQRNYVAAADRAVIMIHMKGHNKMWSFAGLPRLCRV